LRGGLDRLGLRPVVRVETLHLLRQPVALLGGPGTAQDALENLDVAPA
jgi:hypothetical protein